MIDGDFRARGARIVLRSLAATWRFAADVPPDCRAILEGKQAAVIAFWHSQMFPLWFHLRSLSPAAVVSTSKDGAILAHYLRSLGYRNVLRGSSTRRGSIVLNEAVSALGSTSVLMTPDGPRGPARAAKAGAIVAAMRAGVPLVVAGWSTDRSMRFSSWDRMESPLPFSMINLQFARFPLPELDVTARVSDDELTRFGNALNSVSGPLESG